MATLYYAAFDDDGQTPLALFRVVEDDESQTLDIARLTDDGTWQEDPTIIDELQEPGVTLIDPDDAPIIQQELLANSEPGEDEMSSDDVATAAEDPNAGKDE